MDGANEVDGEGEGRSETVGTELIVGSGEGEDEGDIGASESPDHTSAVGTEVGRGVG